LPDEPDLGMLNALARQTTDEQNLSVVIGEWMMLLHCGFD
jgi:hypothetical protein